MTITSLLSPSGIIRCQNKEKLLVVSFPSPASILGNWKIFFFLLFRNETATFKHYRVLRSHKIKTRFISLCFSLFDFWWLSIEHDRDYRFLSSYSQISWLAGPHTTWTGLINLINRYDGYEISFTEISCCIHLHTHKKRDLDKFSCDQMSQFYKSMWFPGSKNCFTKKI